MTDPIVSCTRCPRLVEWTREVAREKRRQFKDETYWGKPVPSFGPIDARLLIVGLAPAAHGANRTGRMFTGDESGRWLYRALHKAGFASAAASLSRDDDLRLLDARITAVVHCAPPDNRPSPQERDACLPHLVDELRSMKHLRAVLALGGFAWSGFLQAASIPSPRPKFAHGASVALGPWTLLGSYHPSQQNTFTRRLTEPMFDEIFTKIQSLLNEDRTS